MTCSILIVDDHPLMAAALANVLRGLRPRVQCHLAATGAAARQLLAQAAAIDLVVLDLALPDTDGFHLLAMLRDLHPGTPALVVSASENTEDMRRAMAAGALGYVAKSTPPDKLLAAAARALRGEVVAPAAAPALPPAGSAGDGRPAAGLLNERQLDVLRLVCAGRSNKFIAYELGVAEKTVKGRITAIFKTLDVDNRTQAVLKAARLGLVTLQDLDLAALPAAGEPAADTPASPAH